MLQCPSRPFSVQPGCGRSLVDLRRGGVGAVPLGQVLPDARAVLVVGQLAGPQRRLHALEAGAALRVSGVGAATQVSQTAGAHLAAAADVDGDAPRLAVLLGHGRTGELAALGAREAGGQRHQRTQQHSAQHAGRVWTECGRELRTTEKSSRDRAVL